MLSFCSRVGLASLGVTALALLLWCAAPPAVASSRFSSTAADSAIVSTMAASCSIDRAATPAADPAMAASLAQAAADDVDDDDSDDSDAPGAVPLCDPPPSRRPDVVLMRSHQTMTGPLRALILACRVEHGPPACHPQESASAVVPVPHFLPADIPPLQPVPAIHQHSRRFA